ncbi:MobF family relaxase [Streptomyces sp. NPDC005953]|uniref:MobF family relaxase n=1 Tax=Streptomyces sp. NPDC005953 TaxID=3156719 RepID=UPI0033D304F7
MSRSGRVGDGRRPAGQSLKDAQERAGIPPGVWMGRGLAGLGLAAGSVVGERELELLCGELRHPDADRIERELLAGGATPAAARLATVLGHPVEDIEKRDLVPLLGLEFVFRPQASLLVLWALGDDRTREVIERAHARAVAKVLEWLADEVAEIRWSSGRKRAKPPGLVVAAFRHFDNRDGFPLLHHHLLLLNRAQRSDGVWYALDTVRLYQHVVGAGTLYTLAMTTEVCEELGLATVLREVTPGLRPVMEIAGVDQELIDWSSTRREQMAPVLERITDEYVQKYKKLPDERGRHGLGWWAAHDTRMRPKPRPPRTRSLHASGPAHRTRRGCAVVHDAGERPQDSRAHANSSAMYALSSGIAPACVCRPWDGLLRTPVSSTDPEPPASRLGRCPRGPGPLRVDPGDWGSAQVGAGSGDASGVWVGRPCGGVFRPVDRFLPDRLRSSSSALVMSVFGGS